MPLVILNKSVQLVTFLNLRHITSLASLLMPGDLRIDALFGISAEQALQVVIPILKFKIFMTVVTFRMSRSAVLIFAYRNVNRPLKSGGELRVFQIPQTI